MELRIYFRMLQKGWWLIALTALIAMSAALALDYFDTPIYRASATYVVSPNPTQLSANDVMRSLDTLDKRSIVTTYAEFLNSSRVYQQTLTDLKLARGDVVGYTYSAVVLPDANILELSVDGPSPAMAALLVNTMGTTAINMIQPLYPVYDISPLDIATPPTIPISPQPLRDAGLALVLGLVVGATLVILREQLLIPFEAYRQRKIIDRSSMAFTRRYFNTLLETEINRRPSADFSVGLVKLNGLSDLIDVLPPSLMNRLLTNVNKVLRKELRGNDMVGRWDEQSFSILLPATSETAARRTMQRILQALSMPISIEPDGEAFDMRPQITTVSGQANETPREISDRLESSLEKTVSAAA